MVTASNTAAGALTLSHRALAGGHQRRCRRAVHQQQQDDEDLACRKRVFGMFDTHREKAGHHRDRHARGDLQPRVFVQGQYLH